jgi:hypothetical protein
MPDFWRNSGFQLLAKGEDGFLTLSGDFLRAYLFRPELAPVEESCQNELRLHAALVEAPLREVSASELAAVEDGDRPTKHPTVSEFPRAAAPGRKYRTKLPRPFSRRRRH